MEFLTENLIIVLILPLLFGVLTMVSKFFGLNLNKKFMIISGLISSFLGFAFCFPLVLMFDNSCNYQYLLPFIDINNFIINIGIEFGQTELILASLLYFVGFIIQIYSVSYMPKEKHNRYFALINMFIFTMAAFIFSPNLFQFYIFWELIGLFSYLLIGFDYQNAENGTSAKKVFLINRIGDFCLLSGIVISSYLMYTNGNNINLTQLPFDEINLIASNLYGYTTPLVFGILCSLFIIAALCKSAQFPFSSWLIHAMAAPTPVSALIHSATLVTAGFILFLKLTPLFIWAPEILTVTVWIVLISAIITSVSAITQDRVKKILAYSTSAHLGIMFMLAALGQFQIAVIYLIAHGIVKSILFCNSGISDTITNEKNMFNLPALYKQNKTGLICVLLAIISITGIAGIGFQEKNYIYEILKPFNFYKYAFITAGVLCSIYLSRMFFAVFVQNNSDKSPDKVPQLMDLSLILLTIGLIALSFTAPYKFTNALFLIPLLVFGICGFIYYKKRNLYKIPLLYSLSYNGFFADNILEFVFVKPFGAVVFIFNYTEKYINLSYKLLVKTFYLIVKLFDLTERHLINQITIQSVRISKKSSILFSKLQNNNTQTYINYGIMILTIAVVCLLIIYKLLYSGLNGGL
ncbi:NADH-quinone oxidoreductase subunit L [bacterium]|nr:NADH-quinone oxidoreductase subunit L [bacterium]